MKPEIIIRDCEAKDIRDMAVSLREEDRREVEASGLPVHKVLWRSFKRSLICKAICVDGELAAIFGVGGSFFDGVGKIWLITSYAVKKVSPLRFARIYQEQVMLLLKAFPALENYVDSSYTSSIRLLDMIGFELSEPAPLWKNGHLFQKYSMRRYEGNINGN